MKLTKLLSYEEFDDMNEQAVKNGLYRMDRRVFTPGMGWYQPYYFDPTGERERLGEHVMFKAEHKGKLGFLSIHYWNDWSDKRSPLCVVCPNGEQWEVDRKSSNGDGWKVTGEWPNITCFPSIVVRGYHGWLKDGEFSPDIEGRGPTGIVMPYA